MSDSPCQLADGVHLLRLPQLERLGAVLGRPAGDIREQAQQSDDAGTSSAEPEHRPGPETVQSLLGLNVLGRRKPLKILADLGKGRMSLFLVDPRGGRLVARRNRRELPVDCSTHALDADKNVAHRGAVLCRRRSQRDKRGGDRIPRPLECGGHLGSHAGGKRLPLETVLHLDLPLHRREADLIAPCLIGRRGEIQHLPGEERQDGNDENADDRRSDVRAHGTERVGTPSLEGSRRWPQSGTRLQRRLIEREPYEQICNAEDESRVTIDAATGVMEHRREERLPDRSLESAADRERAPSGKFGLKELAAGGANYIRTGGDDWSGEVIDAQLAYERSQEAAAAAHGLRCWLCLGISPTFRRARPEPPPVTEQLFASAGRRSLKDHPGLPAYKGIDEPRNPFRERLDPAGGSYPRL